MARRTKSSIPDYELGDLHWGRAVRGLILAVASLLLAQPGLAAGPSGIWAMRAGATTMFRIEVRPTPSGWTGIWVRPEHFTWDSDAFSNVSGLVVSRKSSGWRTIKGGIELTFDDPRPGATPDVFEFRPLDDQRAVMSYVGVPIEPVTLTRETHPTPLGHWNPKRRYEYTLDRPTNSEMTALFDADQAARENMATIDWTVMAGEDTARRHRTQQLLDSSALNSGDDYYHAAFVFQHGDKPADYLKAHLLATIATSRGKASAAWIAAATLDRYLMSIGQAQVLGTQFQTDRQGKTTQGNYDWTLLSDELRQAMRVPALAEQEKQRARIEQENRSVAATKR